MHSIAVYEVQEFAMMGGAGSVACMEGMLLVVIQDGWCMDGLECATEVVVGAD